MHIEAWDQPSRQRLTKNQLEQLDGEAFEKSLKWWRKRADRHEIIVQMVVRNFLSSIAQEPNEIQPVATSVLTRRSAAPIVAPARTVEGLITSERAAWASEADHQVVPDQQETQPASDVKGKSKDPSWGAGDTRTTQVSVRPVEASHRNDFIASDVSGSSEETKAGPSGTNRSLSRCETRLKPSSG